MRLHKLTILLLIALTMVPLGAYAKLGKFELIVPPSNDDWEKRASVKMDMGNDLNNLSVSIFRQQRNDSWCGDGPNYSVRVLIEQKEKLLYLYESKDDDSGNLQCWTSDELSVKDVTNDGIPELLFKTAHYVTNGTNKYQQHVIKLSNWRDTSGLVDVSNPTLKMPTWFEIKGKVYAAAEVRLSYAFDPYRPDRQTSHYGPTYWVGYLWNENLENFMITDGSINLNELKKKISSCLK